jgi:hypothetical protein
MSWTYYDLSLKSIINLEWHNYVFIQLNAKFIMNHVQKSLKPRKSKPASNYLSLFTIRQLLIQSETYTSNLIIKLQENSTFMIKSWRVEQHSSSLLATYGELIIAEEQWIKQNANTWRLCTKPSLSSSYLKESRRILEFSLKSISMLIRHSLFETQ